MTFQGTVVNGVIILDSGMQLPDGARVRVEVADPDDLAPPPEPYDREKELAILREGLNDVRVGRRTPFEEFMGKVAGECNIPPVAPE